MTVTTYTYDDQTVSDLHKDAYGTRPGVTFMRLWKGLSPDDKQGLWDAMCIELEAEMAREKEAARKAYSVWINRMFVLAKDKGITPAEAIKQDVGEDVDGDYGFDYGYYCFRHGLEYKHADFIQQMVESVEDAVD
jgi:hypothetical protein